MRYKYYSKLIIPKYFNNPTGIHGVKHCKRVLYLAMKNSKLNYLDDKDVEILAYASIYHDIGRANDYKDNTHGFKSYEKLLNLGDFKGIEQRLNLEDLNILRFIIEKHNINDTEAKQSIKDYDIKFIDRCFNLYDIFKDCDGLDRVRINDLNMSYLRKETSKELERTAWNLLLERIDY